MVRHFRPLMKALPSLLLSAVLSSTVVAQTAAPATSAVSDEDTAKILAEITKVQRDFAKTKKDLTLSALERLKTAAATDAAAQEFYLAAYKVVNIDRKPAAADDRAGDDWQKRAVDSLGEGPVATTLRMELQLLAMMLDAPNAKSEEALVASLRAYMQAVAAFLPTAGASLEPEPVHKPVATVAKKGKRDDDPRAAEKAERELLRKKGNLVRHLRQKVLGSVFAQAYNLGSYMDAPEKWPQSPVDFAAAYQQVILPWYRANKKAELPAVWDEYLKAETLLEKLSVSEDDFAEWGTREFKQLSWSKWLDLLSNGVTAAAATQELVKIVRENPSHPALKTWIADLARVAEQMGGLKFDDVTAPPGSTTK